MSRRAWLSSLAIGAAGCDAMQPKRGFLGRMEKFNIGVERMLFRHNSGTPAYSLADETPMARWPSYFVSPNMPMTPPGWALRIGGLVARPAVLSVEDLQRMTRTDIRVEHHCVEGWSAIASWHGVRLRDLAARVGADPRAEYVEFRSFDNGYYSSWDRDSAMHPQTLIAYGMAGAQLTQAHGAPARIYSPVKLGYKNVKYLTEINFMPSMSGGYWENLGYEWYGGV
jgi:DMSO/TMAO reductase YedYZ molybdopterin-dependent catalytic subunit